MLNFRVAALVVLAVFAITVPACTSSKASAPPAIPPDRVLHNPLDIAKAIRLTGIGCRDATIETTPSTTMGSSVVLTFEPPEEASCFVGDNNVSISVFHDRAQMLTQLRAEGSVVCSSDGNVAAIEGENWVVVPGEPNGAPTARRLAAAMHMSLAQPFSC